MSNLDYKQKRRIKNTVIVIAIILLLLLLLFIFTRGNETVEAIGPLDNSIGNVTDGENNEISNTIDDVNETDDDATEDDATDDDTTTTGNANNNNSSSTSAGNANNNNSSSTSAGNTNNNNSNATSTGNTNNDSNSSTTEEKTKPTFSLKGNTDITVEYKGTFEDPGIEIKDGTVTTEVYFANTASAEAWEKVNGIDTTSLGVYRILYTIFDNAGNKVETLIRIVSVKDTVAPTATLEYSKTELTNKSVIVTLSASEAITLDSTAGTWLDKGGNVYQKSYPANNVQEIKFNDLAGNEGSVTVTINNIDKVAATIELPGTEGKNNNEMRVESGTVVTLDDVLATVTDNVDGTKKIKPIRADLLISNVASENTYNYDFRNGFDTRYVGRYNIYYEYVDGAGNKSTATMLLVMKDTTAPIVKVKEYIGTEPNYSGMSFKLEDNVKIDYFELNGKKYERTNARWSDANYQNIKSSLVNGENTLVLYDVAGNNTTYTFTLERIAPTITVSDGTVGTGPYSKLNLKMYDASGIASVVINGTKLQHTGEYVDINDGHAYTFLEGENTVVVTDNAGNVTTQTFVVDRTNYYVTNFAELKAAFEKGGKIKLQADIAVEEILIQKAGINIVLDMNGKKLTLKDSSVDPMIDMKTGSSLVIKGNGTIDLEDNYYASFIIPRGDVTIENGKFLRNAGGTNYGAMFVGINGGKGKFIIYDGYFDSGYYKEGDEFNNSRNNLNLSWGQYVRVYGGTFVGQNPAYGDEGMALTNPNANSGYCQGIFLEGQNWRDTEIPSTYTITKGTLADGRPTFTVTYNPNN